MLKLVKSTFFAASIIMAGGSSNASETLSAGVLSTIADPHTSRDQLIQAVEMLRHSKTTNEPPSFWSAIANSPNYSCEHRQLAALQLLARHFHSGMTFGEIGTQLNHPTWVDQHRLGSWGLLAHGLRG